MSRFLSSVNLVAMLQLRWEDNGNLICVEPTIVESVCYGRRTNVPTNTPSGFLHMTEDHIQVFAILNHPINVVPVMWPVNQRIAIGRMINEERIVLAYP